MDDIIKDIIGVGHQPAKPTAEEEFPPGVTDAMAEAESLGENPPDAHARHYAAMAHLRAADKLRMFRFSLEPGSPKAERVDALYRDQLMKAREQIDSIIAGL